LIAGGVFIPELCVIPSLRHFGLVDQQNGNAIAYRVDAAAAGALE
jgi:hypothetical protein